MATYVCADLHGHYEIYEKIKAMLKPGDTVYCLGDCGDRGPRSWETIKAVLRDPQFIYLKGNHEDMLVKAGEDFLAGDEYWDYSSYQQCRSNGGLMTMKDWENDRNREGWLIRLRKLPTVMAHKTDKHIFILSHAGFTPCIENNELIVPEEEELLWSREHFWDKWDDKMDKSIIVVHGHTPNHYLSDELRVKWEEGSGALWYANRHKVCIDCGGFFSNEWVVLNLDTLEEIRLTCE
jgi:calcineurin-like phosphoesterase family protein